MSKPKPQPPIDICLYHCDRINDDCACYDNLPRDWCAYARAFSNLRPIREPIAPPPGEYLTSDEAAEKLGVVKQTILKRIWLGKLPAVFTVNKANKRCYLIPKEAIL